MLSTELRDDTQERRKTELKELRLVLTFWSSDDGTRLYDVTDTEGWTRQFRSLKAAIAYIQRSNTKARGN